MDVIYAFQDALKPYGEVNAWSVFMVALLTVLSLLILRLVREPTSLPGPSPLQMLPNGEIYPLIRDSRATLRTLMQLADKYGDVFQTWMGPSRVVLSANPADIAQILSSTDEFVRPAGMVAMFETIVPGGLFTMPKAVHIAARRRLKENFNYDMVKACHMYLTDAVAELCGDIASMVKEGGSNETSKAFDISTALVATTFRMIVSVAFGSEMSREKRTEFAAWISQIIDEMLKDFMGYPVRQALTVFGVRKRLFRSLEQLNSVCNEFIERRLTESSTQKASRPEDALDAILSLGRDDLRAITSRTAEFALAGSHTTSQVLAWCIFELCRNPRVEAEVEREIQKQLSAKPLSQSLSPEDVEGMTYLFKVWKETVRLHPPGGFIVRRASRETSMRGSQANIAKGTHVIALIQRAQTSPDIWHEPETFAPERWGSGTDRGAGDKVPMGAYVPFSMGQKSCLGMFLANHEAVLILAELYRRFKFTLACDPSEVVSCSGWVESARCASVKGGDLDMGIRVHVQLRD